MRYSFWAAGPTGSGLAKAGRTVRTLFWHRARLARRRRAVPRPVPGKGGFMENAVEKNHVRAVARAGPVLRVVAGVALAVLAGAVLGGCDKATKPKPVKYNIYLGATYWKDSSDADSRVDQLYVYDADSLTRRDSIPLPGPSKEMAASADGLWLYVSNLGRRSAGVPGNIVKIDAVTHLTAWLSPNPSMGVSLLKHGKLVMNYRRVLRASDGATIRQFDDSLTPGGGASSGTKVALLGRARVRIADVETGEIFGDYGPNIGTGGDCPVFRALLHPDEQHVLVIAVDTMRLAYWFIVGNIVTGETLLWDRIFSPYGQLAISADGTVGVCTDPSNPMYWDSPMGVNIVDLTNMKPLKRFDSRSGLPLPAAGQAWFLPGDRRIVMAPEAGWATGPLCVIDLNTMTVVDTVLRPDSRVTKGALGVGLRPE